MLDKFQDDMKAALKAGNRAAVTAYRNILAKLKTEQINQGKKLTREDSLKVIGKYVKQLKDSIAQYEKANRQDLAEKEKFELSILEKYLPKQLTEEEIREIVKQVVTETGAAGMKDMGKVMSGVMKQLAGRGDGKLAQQIVRELLS